MRRFYLPLILFLILVLEGVALNLLPASVTQSNFLIIAHWVLIGVIYIAIFYDKEETNYSVFYAFIFGFLVDIVYTDILGVYMFAYVITVYIIKKLTRLLQSNFISSILFGVLGIGLADSLIYVIYLVIGIADLPWQTYMIYRLIPTIAVNLIFLVIIYPFMYRKLTDW